jgi:hypothetical protein
MPGRHLVLAVLLLMVLPTPGMAAPFSVFPKAGRVVSPDGQFEIKDVDEAGALGQFAGTFHALWVIESATGHSRKLCDYFGLAAVAWMEKDSIIVTLYVGKKTSRALIFISAMGGEAYVLDVPGLIPLVPVELRPVLRENDHLFVEASGLEGQTFHFRVWGYGKHDPSGFRWNCTYSVSEGGVSCEHAVRTGKSNPN